MERISVFDIFKIGVGPSSSHTMGPWVAARRFLNHIDVSEIDNIQVKLFGSLAKTGIGHGTDLAVMLGLMDHDPKTIPVNRVQSDVDEVKLHKELHLAQKVRIQFDPEFHIHFIPEMMPFHPNALTFNAETKDGKHISQTYYSIGGGFVIQEHDIVDSEDGPEIKYPIQTADDIVRWCETTQLEIHEIAAANELAWRSAEETKTGLLEIWEVMQNCIHRGCYTGGVLPGGLEVTRRAAKINSKLLEEDTELSLEQWKSRIRYGKNSFHRVTQWVSTFALAVNEENAAFGRVVTAPTNGAAGVIPAVMMYYHLFCDKSEEKLIEFLKIAGQVGAIFKQGATISAALGGCQAEIGVSSAMAAAGLTHCLGGNYEQALMAAEIAMEHHLGLTCDPIGGLVQVPCIERNTMGSMKAITAANIALNSDPKSAKVTLDSVVKTMIETARDMNYKYKETSEGGLATNVSVRVPEC